MATETSQTKVLEIKDLVTRFYTTDGIVKAVDGVSYDVHAGEESSVSLARAAPARA